MQLPCTLSDILQPSLAHDLNSKVSKCLDIKLLFAGHLEELISVLNGAKAEVSKAIVRQDHCAPINNLVQYYQMVSDK